MHMIKRTNICTKARKNINIEYEKDLKKKTVLIIWKEWKKLLPKATEFDLGPNFGSKGYALNG